MGIVLGIEYACSGNGGRSPQCETFAKKRVKDMSLDKKVNIYSSGTIAEATEKDLFSLPIYFLLEPIEIGVKYGTFMGEARPVAEEVAANKEKMAALAAQGDEGARQKIEYCIRYLMVDEVVKRNIMLLEEGLVPEGPFHQQTVVRDIPENVVHLILPMKQSNADQTKEIYKDNGKNPIIIPICEYAGMKGAIADPFGRPIEVWRETRAQIKEAVTKSIDRAVEEYLR